MLKNFFLIQESNLFLYEKNGKFILVFNISCNEMRNNSSEMLSTTEPMK